MLSMYPYPTYGVPTEPRDLPPGAQEGVGEAMEILLILEMSREAKGLRGC